MSKFVVLPNESQVLAVHAALVHTGHVLLFGGDEHDPEQNIAHIFDRSRLYDVDSGAIIRIGSAHYDVFCAGHCFLGDGKVLVTGGTQFFPERHEGLHHMHFPGLRDCAIYDPSTHTWSIAASYLPEPGYTTGGGRWYPSNITLPSGLAVIAFSGHPLADDTRHNNSSVECFEWSPWNPVGEWKYVMEATYEMPDFPRLFLIPGGRIFFPCQPEARTNYFDLATMNWEFQTYPRPPDPIYDGFESTSVLLPLKPEDNYTPRVLLCGGAVPYIFDLGKETKAWEPVPRTLAATPERHHGMASILLTGEVIHYGGVRSVYEDESTSRVDDAEIFDPETSEWKVDAKSSVIRNYHCTSILLPNGDVWTCGSNKNAQYSFPYRGADSRELRIELFKPWYSNMPTRPIIQRVPKVIYGREPFIVQVASLSAIRRVAIVRNSTFTHGFNYDQRYVVLEFEQIKADDPIVPAPGVPRTYVLRVWGPADHTVAPCGYYMLTCLDDRNVPSKAEFVRMRLSLQPASGMMAQGKSGKIGDYELVLPRDNTLTHFRGMNDTAGRPWSAPLPTGAIPRGYLSASLILSTFGTVDLGNLELVALDRTGQLRHLWRDNHTEQWHETDGAIVQGTYKGNPSLVMDVVDESFIVVAPLANGKGVACITRKNRDHNNLVWTRGADFATSLNVEAVCAVQNNRTKNLEVVVRVTDGRLLHFERRRLTGDWSSPAVVAPVGMAVGIPAMIHSCWGVYGTLELVSPLPGGGIAHFARNADSRERPWEQRAEFGITKTYAAVSMLQGPFGLSGVGDLECLAIPTTGGTVELMYQTNRITFEWEERGAVLTDPTIEVPGIANGGDIIVGSEHPAVAPPSKDEASGYCNLS